MMKVFLQTLYTIGWKRIESHYLNYLVFFNIFHPFSIYNCLLIGIKFYKLRSEYYLDFVEIRVWQVLLNELKKLFKKVVVIVNLLMIILSLPILVYLNIVSF